MVYKEGDLYRGHCVKVTKKGYLYVNIPKSESKTGKYRKLSLHVGIWEEANGLVPKGMEIHHKDRCKTNNNLENLEMLSRRDHNRVHAGWLRDANGVFTHKPCRKCGRILPLSNFYETHGATNGSAFYCTLCKKCDKLDSQKRYARKRLEKLENKLISANSLIPALGAT